MKKYLYNKDYPQLKWVKELLDLNRKELIEEIEKELNKMEETLHGNTEWDSGFDSAIDNIRVTLNKLKEKQE